MLCDMLREWYQELWIIIFYNCQVVILCISTLTVRKAKLGLKNNIYSVSEDKYGNFSNNSFKRSASET